MQFKTLVLIFALLSFSSARASIERAKSFEVFGAPLRWFSSDNESLDQTVRALASELSSALDPDCRYREIKEGACVRRTSELTAKYQNLAKKIEQETAGVFRAHSQVEGRQVLDFGELSQGALLEELARSEKKPWFAEFSGDLYVSPGQLSWVPVGISNPLYPAVIYSDVEMSAGWVFGESGPQLAVKTHEPQKTQSLKRFDFARIVLLGHPSMNGARLDAWASALVSGGKELLKKLWLEKDYRGKWAWVYFTPDWKIACSPNLVCDFSDPKKRKIKAPW